MRVGKYIADGFARRCARVMYANGEIVCDFDARRATISVDGRERGWIAIDTVREAGRYSKNYTVLMSMFTEFALNGWGGVRFDDFERQLDALDWWDRLCEEVAAANVPVHEYEAAPPDGAPHQLVP